MVGIICPMCQALCIIQCLLHVSMGVCMDVGVSICMLIYMCVCFFGSRCLCLCVCLCLLHVALQPPVGPHAQPCEVTIERFHLCPEELDPTMIPISGWDLEEVIEH